MLPWFEQFDMDCARELPELAVLRDEPMDIHTTFRIGGAARRLARPKTIKEISALLTLVENGALCYCGKRGCVEAYCSLNALLKANETLPEFFRSLRSGQKEHVKRWNIYLTHLATAIDNVHMLIDYDIILGGILPKYIESSDITLLHQLIKERTAFPTNREYVRTAEHLSVPNAKGAAIPYIQKYLDSVLR